MKRNGLEDDWDLDTVLIPPGVIISQVQYCIQLTDGFFVGVRFKDQDLNVLIEGGAFHNVNRSLFRVHTLTLEPNERLIGF